jgi:UDP-N-acetyl-D-glucosamine dehydrogenase
MIKLLIGCGAVVTYSDSYASHLEVDEQSFQSVPPTPERLASSDLTMIITDHSDLDYRSVVENAQLIFDTRNATKGIQSDNIVRL